MSLNLLLVSTLKVSPPFCPAGPAGPQNPHLVAWVNNLKGGVAVTVVWCCAALMLLVFQPGVKAAQAEEWSEIMTLVMLVGLAPAFLCGALTSFFTIRTTTRTALKALA